MTSLSSSSRFALNSADSRVSPVILPCGRARLAIRPVPTGSLVATMTIGMLLVIVFCTHMRRLVLRGHDHINLAPDQLSRELRESLHPARRESVLHGEVASLNQPELV